MIIKLSQWKLFQESKLVPRNLDSRREKLKQRNFKILKQEIVLDSNFFEMDSDYLMINNLWDFDTDDVTVKEINGDVALSYKLHHIPKWLKNVKINGRFRCSGCELTTLENCPYYVGHNFYCDFNNLKSLNEMPKYVHGFAYYGVNPGNFTKDDIPKGTIIEGKFKT